jgi:hypothetical protein
MADYAPRFQIKRTKSRAFPNITGLRTQLTKCRDLPNCGESPLLNAIFRATVGSHYFYMFFAQLWGVSTSKVMFRVPVGSQHF